MIKQPELFASEPFLNDVIDIEGFRYVPDFVNAQEQAALLQAIDSIAWLDDLKRRVQHYGYKYDYKKRNIDASMKISALPDWALSLSQRLHQEGFMPYEADQLIINEYYPGQGIAAHIDCEPCFEDTIVSLSLGSACVMDFTHKDDKNLKYSQLLAACSLIVLQGKARYDWLHGIKANKTDTFQGRKIPRQRRVSLTFRKVILKN